MPFLISLYLQLKKVDAKTCNLDIENINVLGRNLIDIDIVPLPYQHLKHEMSGLYTLIMSITSLLKARPHTARWRSVKVLVGPCSSLSQCHRGIKYVISQKLARFHLDDVWFLLISNKKYIRWQNKKPKNIKKNISVALRQADARSCKHLHWPSPSLMWTRP